jgi:hypothetical protein
MKSLVITAAFLITGLVTNLAGQATSVAADPRPETATVVGPQLSGILEAALARAETQPPEGPTLDGSHATSGVTGGGKSPGTALALSLMSTVVPIGAGIALMATESPAGLIPFLGGILVGPSIGHFYAGNTGRGLATAGLRTVSLVGGTLAAYAICPYDGCSDSDVQAATWVLIATAGLTLGSSVVDIATAPDAARRYNERQQAARLRVTPVFLAGGSAPGLAVNYRF